MPASPEDVIQEFKKIEGLPDKPDRAKKFERSIAFRSQMRSLQGPDYDKALYEVLPTKDPYLRGVLRSIFAERPSAEALLVERLRSEKKPEMQGEILQVLGGMRSKHAAPVAREFLEHKSEDHRERALFVLGWVGDETDVPRLERHLLSEKDPHLRRTAASALRQLAWHLPEAKKPVLLALKEGFEHETDDEVLSGIIVMLGTVAVKNLGLREDREDPDVLHGDLETAKKKTAAFVKTL